MTLIQIQKIKQNKIKNFKKKHYKIPIYSKNLLFKETSLFFDWYIPSVIKNQKKTKVIRSLKKIIISLLYKIKLPNNKFVHRDFHVSNLLNYKKKIAVIDSQDAVFGNMSYDLASLIDDVRFKTSKKFKDMIYNYFITLNKNKINKNSFRNDFEILSVLRNLKIIGIFTRLAIRDNKKNYLKLIPYTWDLIDLRLKNNIIFKDLYNILKINFPKRIRVKK